MPNIFLTTHKHRQFAHEVGASTFGTATWIANGLFNVDPAQSAIQPGGFDEMSAIYSKYEVYASSIMVKLVNNDDGSGLYVILAPLPNDASGTFGDFERLAVQKQSKSVAIGVRGGNDTARLSHYVSVPQIKGEALSQAAFQGSLTANPSSLVTWVFAFQNVQNNSVIDLSLDITITYYTKWFDKTDVVPS